MRGAPGQRPGDDPMWSSMSSALIYGERDAVLVDTLVTFDQVDALVNWIDRFDKHLTAIYATHGHADHWIGLRRLQERFPDARGLARPKVHDRAVFEATNPVPSGCWQSVFPGEVPEDPVLPDRFEEASIGLEGHELNVIDIGQGNTEDSTILHIPSIAAVVGGDVVYNQVHMMTAETDEASREDWIGNLDQITALDPEIVVSGHPRVGSPNVPRTISEPQRT
jgi:glyoxylase-like metal-dependent hydrolase (beta-lactamase superfamily II)